MRYLPLLDIAIHLFRYHAGREERPCGSRIRKAFWNQRFESLRTQVERRQALDVVPLERKVVLNRAHWRFCTQTGHFASANNIQLVEGTTIIIPTVFIDTDGLDVFNTVRLNSEFFTKLSTRRRVQWFIVFDAASRKEEEALFYSLCEKHVIAGDHYKSNEVSGVRKHCFSRS
jgi:hypothetical protein